MSFSSGLTTAVLVVTFIGSLHYLTKTRSTSENFNDTVNKPSIKPIDHLQVALASPSYLEYLKYLDQHRVAFEPHQRQVEYFINNRTHNLAEKCQETT